MANYNMQKQADLTDHIEAAVRGGVDLGKSGLRTARDLWHKSILPAMHGGEKVLTEDVINPAISKIRDYAGPGVDKLRQLYRKYGRPAYRYVVKGITGLGNLGRDAANAVDAVREAAPGIRSDISNASDSVVDDLRRLYRASSANSRNTMQNLKRDLLMHGAGSTVNFNKFKNSVKPTLSGAYDSVLNRISSGMNKSSALQGLGFDKRSNIFGNWARNIAKEESELLAREAAQRAAKKVPYRRYPNRSSRYVPKPAPAAPAANEAAAAGSGAVPTGPLNLTINNSVPATQGITREAMNDSIEAAISRAMATHGNQAAASAAASAAPKTLMGGFKETLPSALVYGGLGYGASRLFSGGGQQAQPQYAPQTGYAGLMAGNGAGQQNPLGGPLGNI